MAISKSTPYVRYKKDFTSSLHLGTIHIESEYLDRTQKTTIESIHGMTWHNKVVNENKELNLLSDTQLELTELEKQYWNTGEKCVSVDEIHTLEEVEPNEDGTYTYMVNSMEGEYIEIYDGINNITSTSDGLDGQFEIVYDTTEEDINGNIALDQVAQQYEITDSGVGTITSAKSTGLTLVNHITEPSKEEVAAIEQQEGKHFTIENTVQGNVKSATLKGQTLVNILPSVNDDRFLIQNSTTLERLEDGFLRINAPHKGRWEIVTNTIPIKPSTKYLLITEVKNNTVDALITLANVTGFTTNNLTKVSVGFNGVLKQIITTKDVLSEYVFQGWLDGGSGGFVDIRNTLIEYQEGMENWDIPYFTGMQSVKMPVLTTTGKNLFDIDTMVTKNATVENGVVTKAGNVSHTLPMLKITNLEVGKTYTLSCDYSYSFTSDGGMLTYCLTYDDGDYSGAKDNIKISTSNITRIEETFEAKKNVVYLIGSIGRTYISNIQIEEGIATEYEPHKSNILTVNEEVELRGIGEVKDELNLLTGEVTYVLSEKRLTSELAWEMYSEWQTDTLITFGVVNIEWGSGLVCNRFIKGNSNSVMGTTSAKRSFYAHANGWFICLYKNELSEVSVQGFKEWLDNNETSILYKLPQQSIKTVDLTVQNQDGSTIPHIQTQQGITHVSTSSDVLTPVVEMSCSYDVIIKPNTTYTIKLDRPIVSDTMYLQVDLGGTMMMLDADVNAFTIKTPSTLSHSQLRLSGTGNTVKEIIVLEGNRVNDKIEYFEGMKNVENPILVVSNCQYVFGKGGRL